MVLYKNLFIRRDIIYSKIYKAATACNRDMQSITIIAVTKNHPAPIWETALNLGIQHIGENKIQETIQKKIKFSSKEKIIFHLIGHLQKNKTRKAIEIYDVIQTVDSLELAKKINNISKETNKVQEIYIQTNTSKDPKKFGMSINKTMDVSQEITSMKNLKLTGVMTIPKEGLSNKELSNTYQKTRQIKNQIQKNINKDCKNLSMGMSNDYEIAIQEGATHIRIGTALFGMRK